MDQFNLDKTTGFFQPAVIQTSTPVQLTIFDTNIEPIVIDLSTFGKSVISFGRSKDNDIQLNSNYVSRKHGQFRFVGSNWIIDDLGSRNGLLYNGVNIKTHLLEDGDFIRIDDGIETTTDGLLMVFSSNSDNTEWKTIEIGNKTEISIGRDSESDIVLDHVSVSKKHAIIQIIDEKCRLVDNNSTNGIIVNGQRISHQYKLQEKDVILITNSKLIFGNGKISYCCYKSGISVDATNITKMVDKGRKTICDNVSLNINPCEFVAIVGGSGAGKSTVMNCISGYTMPTEGSISVNGVDLYDNFDALKNIIGYVPQQDIVFDDLTVADMLSYAAKLRLPKDLSNEEYNWVIAHAIDTVELTPHKDKFIRNLSGGQKKRASIAVELLSDPNLFFLDEPASGLDPGTERNLMKTLKSMAMSGKTVVFVTHSTLNLQLCDKIAFMGTGGQLCFYGDYNEALKFFDIEDIVDVYNLITDDPMKYKDKFISKNKSSGKTSYRDSQPMQKQNKRHNLFRQVSVLSQRHLKIIRNDNTRLAMLLLQAPLLGALISIVANGQQFLEYEMTKSLLFALSCSAFWVGTLNSIQEICKERVILRREYMTGLRLDSYILSKMLVLIIICAVQSLLLTTTFVLLIGMPTGGVIIGAYPEFLIVTFLTALAASATGIFVSALFKKADSAMAVAPILLIPQLLFSGLIFELEGATELLSWFAACRFSMEGFGTTANLNDLPLQLEAAGFPIERASEQFFEFSASNFGFAIGMLCVFIITFSIAAGITFRNIKK